MQRFILTACAGLAAAAMALPSLAADVPRGIYKAPPPAYPAYIAPYSWTGIYVGINGGYAWGTADLTTALGTANFDAEGGMVGGTLGYNIQTGRWVWGLEGDFDATWIKDNNNTAFCAPNCEVKNTWFATARGRVGYALDRWLPYITGGAAFADIKTTGPTGASETDTRVGWTIGGGVEYAFLGAWSAKIEYLYVDFGEQDCSATVCIIPATTEFTANIVRAGVNYRF
jgi:outer membrane immunogenic protein